MTYHKRESLESRSLQHQQPYSQTRVFNNSNKHQYSSHSPSQALRIECKTEERHYIDNTDSYSINSSLKPIHFTMNDQLKPVQFRSQIIVHKNPQTDLHIQRLRVAFHYHDDSPKDAILNHHSSSQHNQPLNTPISSLSQSQQQNNDTKRKIQYTTVSRSQGLLHKWIDDICANEQLMSNDDIVFFIKNGEFFARI